MDEQKQPQPAAESERKQAEETVEDLEPDAEDAEAVTGGITWTWTDGGITQA